MPGERSIGRRTATIVALLPVFVLIYFRPQLLAALGYSDGGAARTIFVVSSALLAGIAVVVANYAGGDRPA